MAPIYCNECERTSEANEACVSWSCRHCGSDDVQRMEDVPITRESMTAVGVRLAKGGRS